jgi:hypothetical protein
MALPIRYYWKDVFNRSFRETLVESLGFRSTEQVVIKVVYAGAILGALLWAGSDDAGWDQVVTYLAAVCTVPVVFLGFWAWNFIRLPAKDLAEKDLQISELKSSVQSDRRRIAIKEKLGNALAKGVALMKECKSDDVDNADLEKRANEWFSDLQTFVMLAFGEGEQIYLQHGMGTVVYSGGDHPNRALRNGLDDILQRVTIILQNSDTKPIRDDYVIEKGEE